jgi:hypothetical protein
MIAHWRSVRSVGLLAFADVAAALADLSGIAASDTACCARLKKRLRGQFHAEAIGFLATVAPGGAAMAKDLQRLLDHKHDSEYGLLFVSRQDARRAIGWSKRLLVAARRAVEA